MGAAVVVVKGGHREGPATDLYFNGSSFREFTSPRIEPANTHGTGCTFGAAIAASLANGHPLEEATRLSKHYVEQAIRHGHQLGHGHGPVNHFYRRGDH